MNDDLFEQLNQTNQNWFGQDRGPDDIRRDWGLFGRTKRAQALDELDAHLQTFVDVRGPAEIRKFARLNGLKRDLFAEHLELMKANR
jgi:hypothetical protein